MNNRLFRKPPMYTFIFLLAISIFSLTNSYGELPKLNTSVSKEICEIEPTLKQMTYSAVNCLEIKKTHKSNTYVWERYLEAFSIVFGLSKTANSTYVSDECLKNLKIIELGILSKEPWAMKVLDSSGQKEPGFIWGNDYWLGSQLGCKAAQAPVKITLSSHFERSMKEGLISQTAPFEIDYRVIYISHKSPWQIETKFMFERTIHIGLCLPTTCSTAEIKHLTETLMDGNKFIENKLLELNAEVLYVKDLKLKDSFFQLKSLKIATLCLTLTVLMIILAWCCSDTTLIKANGKISKLLSTIRCFDLKVNARELFNMTKPSANEIPAINGLRSVSCFWIMFAHVMFFMYFTVNNKTFVVALAELPSFQVISMVVIMVDVFFTISGFLQTYNFLRNEKKMMEIRENTLSGNIKAFGKSVFHRYLRLAPLELCLLPIVSLFTSYIEDISVFHITDRNDETCSKYWWRNVLFIQNLFHFSETCLNWTWSLACDLQFYCFILFLLFIYVKHPNLSKSLAMSGLIASIGYNYITGIKHRFGFGLDVSFHTAFEMYINPFIRIIPYIVGSIAGWFLAQKKGKIQIASHVEKSLWNMSVLFFFACMFSHLKRDMSPFFSVTLLITSRLSLSIIVCWIIIGSATGRGVSWSRILESKTFEHINRVSYAIYLVNPFVITIEFSLSKTSSYIEPIQIIIMCIGFGVIVYLTSIVFSLAFEIPYNNLSRLMSKKNIKNI